MPAIVARLAKALCAAVLLVVSTTEPRLLAQSGQQAGTPVRAPSGGRGVVRGVVRDGTGRALGGARISVMGVVSDVESQDEGAYTIGGLAPGVAQLLVRRIGYAPETLSVAIPRGGLVTADPVLRRLAVPLDAVIVNGRADLRGPIAEFYARMARGNGRFFTQDMITRRNPARMSDLLRGIPGLRVESRRYGVQQFRLRGATLAPLVWLDGTPMGAGEVDLDNFDPKSFAGIEIYSGSATVPVEFSGSRTMSSSGGAVVLWTRQGTAGPPRRKKGAPTPALLVAEMVERGQAFSAERVDVAARPPEDVGRLPIYPDSLYAARIEGRIEVEFVVNADGRVRMDTYSVVSTTHRMLGEPVRRALESASFVPAVRAGRPVSQVVQLPFEFVPDSAAAARKPKD
ncbi:MAG: TonB family protein [Gemmatimonadetes bacterium]|nr:TonB family protein [Gemmatimonadota bacterium]